MQLAQSFEIYQNLFAQDLKLKYRRTFLGYFWSLLNPIFQLTVLSVVFSHFVGRGVKDYTLYLFAGWVPWMFYQTSLISCATALLDNENFIKKIYLPKVLFVFSRMSLRLFDFVCSFVALGLIGAVMHFPLHSTLIALPLAILNLLVFTFGGSLLVSVAIIYFRDIQYLTSFFLQLLYYLTPILVPISSLPENIAYWLRWNPMYWEIRLFQCLIYEGTYPSGQEWGLAFLMAVGSLGLGVWVFKRFEHRLVFRL